ncbi:PEP-CTERM sorting domain-containing protein [Aphanothece sacrum]|nr:PEP-CTERM sorting domain-containing protein [Aphanothece sacrum]
METRAFLLQSVPESNTIVGLLAVGILGLVKLQQRKL